MEENENPVTNEINAESTPQNIENEPLTENQMLQLLKQVREVMGMFEMTWNETSKELSLKDSHMRELCKYNEEHRIQLPEITTDEVTGEEKEYDPFNGLDNIPDEKLIEIFGEDHPLMIARSVNEEPNLIVKNVVRTFFDWLGAAREYKQIHDAYIELMEFKEDEQINYLRELCDKETDPNKKAVMQASIDEYYNRKYLDFLATPLDELTTRRLVKAFSDERQIQYWIERSRNKLNSLGISPKFILEISQFEKRFLSEEYHHQSNIFLLYFMNLLVYANLNSTKDPAKHKVICIVFALDRFIRNVWKDDIKTRILNNMNIFQSQFLGLLPKKESTNVPNS
jgi:hypothetical protein